MTEFERLEEQGRAERKRAQDLQALAEQRAADQLLREEGLQEANNHLRTIITQHQQGGVRMAVF